LVTATEGRSQAIVSVTTATDSPVVEIDPSTGITRTLFNAGFAGGVRFEVSAFDPLRRRLFYLGEIAGTPQLITLDLVAATAMVRPIPVTGTYVFFEYDLAADRILGATNAAGVPIVAIDPTNGNVQPLISTGFTGGVRFEVSSYDLARRRLFLLGDDDGVPQLINVDLARNHVTVRPIPTSGTYLFFEYDLRADRLLAATTAPGIPIVSIHPSDGTVLPMITTGYTGAVRFEVSAFDDIRRRLFFLGENAETPQLVTIDLNTTSVHLRPIPTAGAYLFFEFAPAITEIPALQPASLLALAIALAVTAAVTLRNAA